MNDIDINIIKFRNELIELLNKYDYELSGTVLDDGSMNISDLKNNKLYLLKDIESDYEILKDKNNSLVDISSGFILSMFPDKQNIIKPEKTRIGVFTNNYWKASKFFTQLVNQNKNDIKYYKSSEEFQKVMLRDETKYVWIKTNQSSRGYRCSQAYIDKNLTLLELLTIVLPICVYCERKDVQII